MRIVDHRQEMVLRVNGEQRRVFPRPADTLLLTLREELGLTGAKPGCENGDCGACTVVLDGWPIKSCLVLTAETLGKTIVTVEGLHQTPEQRAFLNHWAFQCGYCTSGFLMVTHALRAHRADIDGTQVVDWMRSNICRCTGYEEILAAVHAALQDPEP